MSAFRPSLWTSALSALLAAPALAQPAAAPAAPAVELEPVVITANPFGRDADEVVQPVDVLGGEALERQRRATLGETLEGQLGVSSSDFGPGVGRPVIRGQAGARVAVLENGIGTLDASTVSADHAVGLDPAHAEQIEIFKGPATLMFGSNAAAGVVNVVTARVPDAPVEGIEGLAETSYSGNASERLQRAQVRFGGGGLVVGGDIATRRAGDFEIPGFAESAALRAAEAEAGGEGEEAEAFGRLPNSALSADSGSVYGGWVRPGLKASAALSVLQTDYGIPGGHGHHGEAEAEAGAEGEEEGGVRIDLRQVRSDLGLDLANPFAGFERLRARLGHNDYQHTELEPGGEAGTVYTNRETESRLELTHAPRAGWRGVAGVQLGSRDFAAIGEEAFVPVPVHTQSRALFLIEEKPLSFGRLELGARVESVRHRPEGTAGNDRDYTPLSLSAGLLWDLDAHRHLRLNLTRAQRAPVPEELYADGPHLATGTFELGAVTLGRDFTEETSTNLELSLDQHHGRFSATVNLFYNPIRDYGLLAATDEDGDGQADRVNEEGEPEADGELLRVEQTQADARFYGAEAEARYRFLSGPLRLSGRVFADLVRGELDAGPHLPRITPTRYGLGLDGGWRGFQASLTLTEVADQTRVADLESPTEGYRLLSADLSHRWTLGELQPEVYVQGRNLLDEEARRHTSFLKDRAPLPGVTVLGGLRLRFF